MLEHPAITRMMARGIEYDYVATCRCGNGIQRGEMYFMRDDETICQECMQERIDDMSIAEIAEALGYDKEGEET